MIRNHTFFFCCLALVLAVIPLSTALAQTLPDSRPQISLSFAPLVKKVTPAVVNIYTQKRVQQGLSPLFADPFFRQFFGDVLPRGYPRERMERSLGSGVLVHQDGLVVTSHHVVEGADKIRVVLSDKREFDALVLTSDPRSDLTVLKISAEKTDFPFLSLADSDHAEIGDLVMAIGNPFGVGQTVTSGIISAFAERAVTDGDLTYFIQTDAAINPGNSGGALVDMRGQLVGINAAIYSRDGGNMGIGFAVPANMVRAVLTAAEQGKSRLSRPWLGFDTQNITPDMAASLNLTQPRGVMVTDIHASSPARAAGLRTGDIITRMNNHDVDTVEALHYRTATHPLDTPLTLTALRKGRENDIHFTVTKAPETTARDRTRIKGLNPLAGTTIENLSPAVAEEQNLPANETGVIITAVDADGTAASLGLRKGDKVTAINDKPTPMVKDIVAALSAPNRTWILTLSREGQSQRVIVRQ